MSSVSSRRLDAFDQWCICRILRIPYVAHVTNDEVRHRTNQPPVTSTIRARWLRLFDHIARANPSQYHLCVLRAAINRPPAEWPHQTGRPRWTWFCTVKLDVCQCNIGLHSAWQCVQDRCNCKKVMETDSYALGRACHLMRMIMSGRLIGFGRCLIHSVIQQFWISRI